MIDTFIQTHGLNLLAFAWFVLCFKGYMYYARKASFTKPCLASVLHLYRKQWMLKMLEREVRIADTTAVANLERSVSFFASTTMLILAGLMTMMGSSEEIIDVLADIPFASHFTRQEWELKVLLLMVLFVYAFFKFTWSLRQYGFVSVMIGGAPGPEDHVDERIKNAHAERIATMSSKAASNFNIGLRTFYFAMAVLGWFVSPWLFMFASGCVAYILYRREFRSTTLKTLMMSTDPSGSVEVLDKR